MANGAEGSREKGSAWRWTVSDSVRARVLPLVLLNLAALIVVGNFLNAHLKNFGGHDIQFLLLAEALAKGAGYVNLHLPGAPIHTHYPPLYAALLAPLVKFGAPLVVLKAWTAVLGVIGFNLAYLFLVPLRGRRLALLAVIGAMLSQSFIDFGLHCMSDGPYLLFSFAALLFVRRTFAEHGPWKRNAVLAGVFSGLAVLLRTVGLVLAPAIAIYAFTARAPGLAARSRLSRLVVIGLVTLFCSTPWLATIVLKRAPVSYVLELTNTTRAAAGDTQGGTGGVLQHPLANIDVLAREASPPGMRPILGTIYLVFFALTIVPIVVGLARGVALDREIGAIYAVVYFLVVMVWVPAGYRLLMPLFPLLLSALCGGVELLTRRFARPRLVGRLATGWLAGIAVVELAVIQFVPLVNQQLHGHEALWWRQYLRVVCTLGTIADPGSTVVSQPLTVPYYLAGLPCAPVRGRQPDVKQAILDSGASYVILSPSLRHRRAFKKALIEAPDRFRPIVELGPTEIFAVVDPATPPDWGPGVPRPYSARCQQLLTYEAD
ncbi:MAG: glycosyltransferase family 39 protein [Acidobacteria bacterium]|nr:glycosyltransferase family 39 protein [Acidobacteriota bacterium]